ncbi:HAD family hydrolase [Streptomyces sp. NPDC008141]|uniref:HAD family hydrolase n=1 Tax=Streptomyces sp. NPDC008141 TaxID=3364815 RepID=UPI0036E7507F
MQLFALFDLDNTLIARQAGLDAWARDFVRSRALPARAERLITEALSERAYPSDFDWLRESLSLTEPVTELWRLYVDGMSAVATCSPGVRSGLRKMREAGWTLGVVTNGATDIQQAKIKRSGLRPLVDGVCVSDEAGSRKPSPGVFEAAADRCGVQLSEGGWMIGDNAATDVEGGRAVGLQTAWVAAGRRWPPTRRLPDMVVETAADAMTSLTEWGTDQRGYPGGS